MPLGSTPDLKLVLLFSMPVNFSALEFATRRSSWNVLEPIRKV